MKTQLLFIAAILFISIGCEKEQGCRGRDYTLEHPMTVYPVQESYSVGDTIWIEMNFPDVFTLRYPNLQNTNEYFTTIAKLVDFDFHRNFLRLFRLSNQEIPAFSQPSAWNEIEFNITEGLASIEGNSGVEYKLKGSTNFCVGSVYMKMIESSWIIHSIAVNFSSPLKC